MWRGDPALSAKEPPLRAVADEHGALAEVVFQRSSGPGGQVTLPARTLCVAAGTSPNTIYEKEMPGTFQLDKKGFFAPHAASREGGVVRLAPHPNGFFTSYLKDG